MESSNYGAAAPNAVENIMNLRPKAVVACKGDNYGMTAPKVLRKPVLNESRPVAP